MKEQKESGCGWICFLNKHVEPYFWCARTIAVIAVVVSFIVTIIWYVVAATDLVHLLGAGYHYFSGFIELKSPDEARNKLVFHTVEAIDSILMASIFLVFTYGLYELFISELKTDEDTEDDRRIRGRILRIGGVDELKAKLVQLILMVLIVKIFYYGLTVKLSAEGEAASLSDVLKLGGVVLTIALALFFSHSSIRYEGGGSAHGSKHKETAE